jgi:hypothetical protein
MKHVPCNGTGGDVGCPSNLCFRPVSPGMVDPAHESFLNEEIRIEGSSMWGFRIWGRDSQELPQSVSLIPWPPSGERQRWERDTRKSDVMERLGFRPGNQM